ASACRPPIRGWCGTCSRSVTRSWCSPPSSHSPSPSRAVPPARRVPIWRRAPPTPEHAGARFLMRILVTNDDGIDAPGIAHLVDAMLPLGDVVVVAPDREFSGASVSVGSLMHHTPGVRRRTVPGAAAAWAVAGPPALCVLYAQLGLL